MKGISTIIATIMMVVITIGLVSVAYLYMSGLITSRTTQNIQLVDAFCRNNKLNILIKNIGTTSINSGSISFIVKGSAQAMSCDTPATFTAGNSTMCVNTTVVAGPGPNEIRVIGPSNAVGGTVNC